MGILPRQCVSHAQVAYARLSGTPDGAATLGFKQLKHAPALPLMQRLSETNYRSYTIHYNRHLSRSRIAQCNIRQLPFIVVFFDHASDATVSFVRRSHRGELTLIAH